MDYNVYNYLTADHTRRTVSKYDAHKPSELRSVMKKITKMTQSSPVYLIRLSNAKQTYALNLKDGAISLSNTLQMMSEDSLDNVFSRRKAYSTQEEQVNARIITDNYDMLPDEAEIKVNHLASHQVNMGKEFYTTGKGLGEGTYRFTIAVNDNVYDFQYNIRKDANHKEVIEGLSNFITKAKIGITAAPMQSADKIQMRLESDMTGSVGGEPIFRLQDKEGKGIVDYYALDKISSFPRSASFELNGADKTSLNNTFILGKTLEVSLYAPGETAAQIRYLPDSEQIISSVQKVMDSYNKLVDSTLEYAEKSEQPVKMVRELRGVLRPYLSEMEACGITLDDQGHMVMDEALAVQAAEEGDMEKTFGKEAGLNRRLQEKTSEIKINPMEYVDKILVSYPDFSRPPRGFSYITSLYSGMLFNYYC